MPTGVYIRKKENNEKMSQVTMGHPVSIITRKRISKALVGNPKLIGRRNSPKTEFKKGILSTPKPFVKGHKPWNKGMKGFRAGEKNNMWRGGTTSLVRMLRTSFEYRQWRSDVYTRDNFTCVNCGKGKTNIHADHIKMLSEILRENNIKTYGGGSCVCRTMEYKQWADFM